MKTCRQLLPLFVLLFISLSLKVHAQSYAIDWSSIDGGGGTSTGGVYSVSGTIGQPDAGRMSGGNYSIDGGFWGLVAAVQTPGAPTLFISQSGNVTTVYWQQVAGWNLIKSTALATPMGSWPSGGTPTLTGGTNYLSVTNPVGNIFYRLKQ